MNDEPTVEDVANELGLGLELIDSICRQSDAPVKYLDDVVSPPALARLVELAGNRSPSGRSALPLIGVEQTPPATGTSTDLAVFTAPEPATAANNHDQELRTLRGEAPRPDRDAHLAEGGHEGGSSLVTSLRDRAHLPNPKLLMVLAAIAVIAGFLYLQRSSDDVSPPVANNQAEPYFPGPASLVYSDRRSPRPISPPACDPTPPRC